MTSLPCWCPNGQWPGRRQDRSSCQCKHPICSLGYAKETPCIDVLQFWCLWRREALIKFTDDQSLHILLHFHALSHSLEHRCWCRISAKFCFYCCLSSLLFHLRIPLAHYSLLKIADSTQSLLVICCNNLSHLYEISS